MRPLAALKSAAVKLATPLVVPSAAASVAVTLPARYERAPEKVVDAVHVGTPFNRARTLPAVPAVVVEIALVPFPYTSAPD